MASTVKSRLSHYQVLGIAPTAASDEIAGAFKRHSNVLRPHAYGGLAEVCIAYETLRDPIKRRAYDASLGLKPVPTVENWSRATPGAPYRSTATVDSTVRPVVGSAMHPAPQSNPKPWMDSTTALRPEPVKPGPPRPTGSDLRDSFPATRAALPLRPGADLMARPEPSIGREFSGSALEEELGLEVRPVDWRRTGTALAAFAVAACSLGGLAGWWSARDVDDAMQQENAVSVSLPPAKAIATQASPPTPIAAIQVAAEPPLARPKPAVAPAPPTESAPVVEQRAAADEQLQQIESQPDASVAEAAAEVAPPAPTIAAAMPLPNRVVARTIERIGYSCGSVVSTVPVEGEASGVFKVNCASGQSYQAKPVKGRYHFRRWGRQ